MGITGINCEGSLEVGSSRMKITGVNCEGSLETAEEVEVETAEEVCETSEEVCDVSSSEFIENINGLYDLQPRLHYYYIDLRASDKPLFKVSILIEKSTYERLDKNSNLEKLLNKGFAPFHENILYGYGSVESLSESAVEVLDTNGEFKTLSSSSSGERHAYLGESIGDYLEAEIGNVVVDKSSVYLDEKNQEYRLEIAYEFDRINMKLLRHSLDGTLYELL